MMKILDRLVVAMRQTLWNDFGIPVGTIYAVRRAGKGWYLASGGMPVQFNGAGLVVD